MQQWEKGRRRGGCSFSEEEEKNGTSLVSPCVFPEREMARGNQGCFFAPPPITTVAAKSTVKEAISSPTLLFFFIHNAALCFLPPSDPSLPPSPCDHASDGESIFFRPFSPSLSFSVSFLLRLSLSLLFPALLLMQQCCHYYSS